MRVLLVEPDEALAQWARTLLSRKLHVARVVGTAALAATVLKIGKFEAVVARRGLPDGTGLDVLDKAREYRVPRLVLVTSLLPPEEVAILASRGVTVLLDPYGPGALLAAIGDASQSGQVPACH